MTSVESGVREAKHFIGGEWTDASDGATFEDRDPFTGEVVANVAAGTRADATRAIEAAAAAFPEWSQSLPAQRQAIFLKAADILESRRDEVVGLLARETGCSFGFGMFQMSFVAGRTVRGIVEGDSVPDVFLPRLVRLWEQGRFPVERLMRHYDFDRIEDAVADAENGRVIKPVLRMS